ncbi:MAG TPA: MFS transporter [Gryllotalpicola sp.]
MSGELPAAPGRAGLGSARPGLLILALAVFAGVTTETLPVGLLPAIGAALGTSEPTAGLLVSLYAALVAVFAVPLTIATRRVPRKRLLLVATGCFVLSNALAAFAPDFAVLAAARALGGLAHAVFFSLCIGYAARLVPAGRTGAALALASSGISAGFVLGVPLATALGNAVGWRGAFVALTVLMALVFVLVAVRLPAVEAPEVRGASASGRGLRLLGAVSSNALLYTGHYVLYTFVTVLLLRAGAATGAIGPILLVFGGFGLIGVWLAGPRLDAHFRRTTLVVLAVMCAALLATGASLPALVLVIVAAAVWNGAFGPTASIYQAAAVHTEATTADLAGAWVVATSNLGIAAGSALGGVVLAADGIRTVVWVAAVFVAVAAVIVVLARRAFPRAI